MQIAIKRVLDELTVPLPVGHVMGAKALRCGPFEGRNGQIQAPQQAPELASGEEFFGLGDDGVDISRLAVPPQLQIHHDLPIGISRAQMPGDRPGQLGQLHPGARMR